MSGEEDSSGSVDKGQREINLIGRLKHARLPRASRAPDMSSTLLESIAGRVHGDRVLVDMCAGKADRGDQVGVRLGAEETRSRRAGERCGGSPRTSRPARARARARAITRARAR